MKPIHALSPLLLLLALPLAARAEREPDEARSQQAAAATDSRALAEMLFFTARGLMEAGRYAEACAKLAESHRLDPASGTLLNLAVCHEQEGKIASAWGEFRQSIVEARRAGRADREALASEHAEALEQELPFLAIEVPHAARVPGLRIERSGVPLQEAAWGTELPVDPGMVELVLRAPGHRDKRHRLVIARREHRTLLVEPLVALPVAAPPRARWTPRRKTGLSLLLGGVLVGSAGAVAGVLALKERSRSDDACPTLDGELRCSASGVSAMQAAQRWALTSDLALGVGAVGIAVGTYLLATGRESTPRGALRPATAKRAPRARWSWRFTASAQGAGGSMSRRF